MGGWAVRFGVALVSATLVGGLLGGRASANGAWRLGSYICNIDSLSQAFNDDGAVKNGDADSTGFLDCVIPVFADGTVPTGTDRTCDLDVVSVRVNDADSGSGTSNGVSATLLTNNGTWDVVDVCTTINTESIAAGYTGTVWLTYDEVDGGATEGDIDDCTNDNNTEWLMMHLSLPDQTGMVFSGVLGFWISDSDDEASGCSST